MSSHKEPFMAAASSASACVTELIEEAREDSLSPAGNIGSGEALEWLADSLRLMIEARRDGLPDLPDDAAINQLHGELVKFLEDAR